MYTKVSHWITAFGLSLIQKQPTLTGIQTYRHYGYRLIAFTASNAATMREANRSKYADIFEKKKKQKYDFENKATDRCEMWEWRFICELLK